MHFLVFILFSVVAVFLRAQKISSPTGLEIFRFLEGEDRSFLQPATSGTFESAMFGMVRNGGSRFHEGVDIKSVSKMGNGRPQDLVYAVYKGKIVHISKENNGSYGRYVVLTHEKDGVELYSLYAHLFVISPLLREGKIVEKGSVLGMIGQTSTVYKIPVDSAHLHFEIGFVLGDEGFDSWFLRNYGVGNLHGLYNGFNLVGADPVDFYSFHRGKKDLLPAQWIKNQKVAFTLRYPDKSFPGLLKRSPALCGKALPAGDFFWEIDFTWFGLPIEFRPVEASIRNLEITIKDAELCRLAEKRSVLAGGAGRYFPGKTLKNYLEILFNLQMKDN